MRHVCQAYECGAIINPANLYKQVTGAIIMGIGPALREEVRHQLVTLPYYSVFDWLEAQIELVKQVGEQNYLAQQIKEDE